MYKYFILILTSLQCGSVVMAQSPDYGNVNIFTSSSTARLGINGNQEINGGYLKFTGGYGDANDGKIVNSHFAPGLNITGINNDNTYRKIHIWGEISQQQNDGTNNFNNNTVFNSSVYTNGQSIVGVGPSSFIRAGAYLSMGHTAYAYAPYISFNAQLTSSNLPNGPNMFSPIYASGSGMIMMGEAGTSSIRFMQRNYGGNGNPVDVYSFTQTLSLNTAGEVGIGLNDLSPTGYKLAVNGNIVAKKIRITQGNGSTWPDYVFDQHYKLATLDSVEAFVNQHKHLPDVLSAKQVNDEGIDLGDNQASLLKKIEELTLYMIQLNKIVRQQQEQFIFQNSKIDEQKAVIDNLQKRLNKKR